TLPRSSILDILPTFPVAIAQERVDSTVRDEQRPLLNLWHEHTGPQHTRCASTPIVRLPAPSRLSHVFPRLSDRHAGRQHRARHQLLGRLPEVPFPGARRVRRAVTLAAVPALFSACGSTGGSLGSAPTHPAGHGALHVRIRNLGHPL